MNIEQADRWRLAAPLPAMRAADPSRSAADLLLDALAFAIPLLLFVELSVIGRLFLPEVLLLILLPVLVTRQTLGRVPRWLIVLALMWLFGQVLTDTVRNSAFADYARGWANIAFTITNVLALILLLSDNRRRILLFGLGLAAGFVLQYYLNPGLYAASQPWKFGLGWPITLFGVLLVSQGPLVRRRLVPPLVLAILAVVNLDYGFRSLAGVCFLGSAYLVLQLLPRSRPAQVTRLPFRRLLTVCVVGVAAAALFMQLYSYSAQSGLLGLSAQRKYQEEAGGAWGLILGGRPEALVSVQAILDSPIIGHGSWAKNSFYTDLFAQRLASYGYTLPYASVPGEPGLIPTHSYLLGAWVDAGMLGGLFWLAVLLVPAVVLANLFATRLPLSPLAAFAAFALTWDVLFSPYGATGRLTAPFYIVVLLVTWQQLRSAALDGSVQTTAPGSSGLAGAQAYLNAGSSR